MANNTPASFNEWLKIIQQSAVAQFHRMAIVLSGDKDWCREKAKLALDDISIQSVLWVSSELPDALPPKKARTQLGKEYDAIVFDAHDQLDVDAFGAISGTLRGGGLLLLLLPLQQNWQLLKTSRFHQRAWPILQHHVGVVLFQQNHSLPDVVPIKSLTKAKIDVVEPFYTPEQQQVVNAIETSVLQKHNKPIVLVSDRGRGKSSALGLAAGRLLQEGINNIIVTAPRLSTSDPVFLHAQRICPNGRISRGQLITGQGKLQFMAPDALLIEKPQADLLLVDEASAIPLHLLEQFLKYYPSIVFATTVHGYEGTGRGFSLKFSKVLDAFEPGWKQYEMETPVRWALNDPVEAWVDKILCMDADLQAVPPINEIDLAQLKVHLVDRDQLVKNESRLSSLFALLVNAHYRTQPSDLLHLLDDPQVRIYMLIYDKYILGAVLINEEGGYDDELSAKIYRGERRPSGNLLAQTLTFHAGCETAATLKYARIMRIAVHPELQGKGLGSHLLMQVILQEKMHVAAIGTSFGASVELIRFWKRAGLELVRIGFTRDHASGTHSAVMLRGLNPFGEAVFNEVRDRFQHYVAAWLVGPLHDLPDDMKQLLQEEQLTDVKALTVADWKEINSFANANRSYEATMWPLMKMINQYAGEVDGLPERDQEVIQARIRDNRSWSQTAKLINASGKTEAIQYLRKAIRLLVSKVNGV